MGAKITVVTEIKLVAIVTAVIVINSARSDKSDSSGSRDIVIDCKVVFKMLLLKLDGVGPVDNRPYPD